MLTLQPKTPPETWANDTRGTLSPSALGAYEICGRRGQYYHDPSIPRYPSVATAVGSAWHHGMERIAKGEVKIDELVPVLMGAFEAEVSDPHFYPRPGETLEQGRVELAVLAGSYARRDEGGRWDDPDVEIVAIEQEVRADFGSEYHVFHGVIDRVIRVNNTLIGLDEKTANRAYGGPKAAGDPRQLPQAPLYAEAWALEFGEEFDYFAYDVTTKTKGQFQRIWVPVTPEARAPFIERWRNISRMIGWAKENDVELPTNPSHFLCSAKWCDYYTICPMGQSMDAHLIPQP